MASRPRRAHKVRQSPLVRQIARENKAVEKAQRNLMPTHAWLARAATATNTLTNEAKTIIFTRYDPDMKDLSEDLRSLVAFQLEHATAGCVFMFIRVHKRELLTSLEEGQAIDLYDKTGTKFSGTVERSDTGAFYRKDRKTGFVLLRTDT